MKLKLDITPDLVAAMAAEVKAGEKAVTAAMREAGTGLKTAWRGQITGALPKIGRMNLAYFPDSRGHILTEMSIIRRSEDEFTLITAATAQWHDFEVLNKNLPAGLTLEDITTQFSTLIVTGPKSRELFEKMGTDAELKWQTRFRQTTLEHPTPFPSDLLYHLLAQMACHKHFVSSRFDRFLAF